MCGPRSNSLASHGIQTQDSPVDGGKEDRREGRRIEGREKGKEETREGVGDRGMEGRKTGRRKGGNGNKYGGGGREGG